MKIETPGDAMNLVDDEFHPGQYEYFPTINDTMGKCFECAICVGSQDWLITDDNCIAHCEDCATPQMDNRGNPVLTKEGRKALEQRLAKEEA